MIERMCFINLVGHISDIDRVIEKYVYEFDMQLEYATERFNNRTEVVASVSPNPYNLLAKTAEKILAIAHHDEKNISDQQSDISSERAIAIIENRSKTNDVPLDSDIQKIVSEDILAAKKVLDMQTKYDMRKFCGIVRNNFFIFTGWVTKKTFKKLDQEVKNDKEVLLVIDDKANQNPPILLNNNSFFKPFEFLVKMYGLPSYYEIDPTPFLALTYTILFGLMFGDVGQGIVLFLAGLFMGIRSKIRNKTNPFANVISSLGFSSMIFGFLYGSVFGFENIIPTVWVKPADNITFILFFAVAAGILLIVVSMIFNLINCHKSGNIIDMFVGPNGLSGFIFYGCVILICFMTATGNKTSSLYNVAVILAIFNLFLIAFYEPIRKILRGEKKVFGNNIFLFLFETVIELFETLLSYFTNTVSFVRVGAFALSHAGMMSVVMLLAKSTSGSYNWFVIALGNMLVVVLEGLIVGIQALRLEFYEMFGRFFKGDGHSYSVSRRN